VLLSLVASGIDTQAQDATPEAMTTMATHPVVGTWELTGELGEETFPILAMFHADGTYMELYPWGAIFVGVRKPTGERTAEGLILGYGLTDDRLERGEGRWRAEVDETGNTIHTDGPFVARFLDDRTITLAVEGPVSGTRLEVLPVVPLAELVPEGTPVIPADPAGEATPAP
jgi:hypothetical protein